ncbi:hypothetical protein IJQ51_03195 [Candidatus Saccharibacteria bacterium]|nr:hypothetical protein [Candidatus Saccharibacteria bacterium]
MQPENNLNTQALEPTQEFAPVQTEQPAQAAQAPAGQKQKMGNLIVMIVLAVLAVAGVTFGIVMMLNGGKSGGTLGGSFTNPVVEDPTGTNTWSEYYESSRLYVDGTKTVEMIVKNGEVDSCQIQGLVEVPTEDGKGTMTEGATTECVVSGLTKDIYKIVEFGQGISPEDFNLGFIMTDGTVYYVNTMNAIENNNFAVRGPLSVSGYVVDSLKIDIAPTEENPGGALSSVFVLQDGSLVEFNSSMLK